MNLNSGLQIISCKSTRQRQRRWLLANALLFTANCTRSPDSWTTCSARSVNLSGLRKCAVRNRVHLSCGGLLMSSWVVDPVRPVRPLLPLIFTGAWTISTCVHWQQPDLRLLLTRGHRRFTETCCWLCRCHRWLDAFQSTSAQCIQDGSTVVRFSPSTKSATFRSIGCWLWSHVPCQMHAWSQYFHWRWPDDAYPSQSDMFKVFCCPLTTTKHTPICVKRRDAVARRGAGVFQAWLRLCNSCRPSVATHGQASVCTECRCMADLQSLSSGPHSAITAQITLASDARTRFVPSGSAGVSLPPRLCA